MLEGSDEIYDVSVVDYLNIIKYNVGDKITLEYTEGQDSNAVLGIK